MSKPNSVPQVCIEDLNDSKITVKRDGQRATFDNFERVTIKCIDVDCWISSPKTRKADFIVSKPGLADVIVELKGKNIDYAVKQILATLDAWKKAPPFSKRVGGLIVFSRCPLSSAQANDLKKRLLGKHGLWLEIDKNQKTEYRFETFAGKKP